MDNLIPIFLSKYDESINNFSDLINFPEKEYLIDTSLTPVSDGIINFIGEETFNLEAYFLGAYHLNEKVWIWNWVHPLSSNNIQLGINLINYALNFDEEKLKRNDFNLVRSILVNSRIKINNDINLEILMGLIIYITKVKVIIPIEFKLDNKIIIYYYGIKNPSNKIYS